jgi:hypothetical protein
MDVSFQAFVPATLPFPPKYMLIDLGRVYAPREPAASPPDGGPGGASPAGSGPAAASPPDGERTFEADGEVVTERWTAGRLVHRAFRRIDGQPPGEIAVEYEGGMPPGGPPPARVVFRNGWYGYRLDITTLDHSAL